MTTIRNFLSVLLLSMFLVAASVPEALSEDALTEDALSEASLSEASLSESSLAEDKKKPKNIVIAFYQSFFVDKKLSAIDEYLSKTYIQHNPYLADGSEPLRKVFISYYEKYSEAAVAIKRVIAEGDLVVVHSHWKKSPDEAGSAVVDIFRVADGVIVEHWDVVQSVPEISANRNTMF